MTEDEMMVAENGYSQNLAEANNLMGKMNQAMDLYARCKEVSEKRKAVEAWSKVKITEGERDKALTKYYDLLDKAVNTGDNQLIIAALQGISGIVTSSPLSDFQEFARLWENTDQPLLDF